MIDVPSRGENYRFAMHRWLAVDEEDGKIEIELEPTDISQSDKSMESSYLVSRFSSASMRMRDHVHG